MNMITLKFCRLYHPHCTESYTWFCKGLAVVVALALVVIVVVEEPVIPLAGAVVATSCPSKVMNCSSLSDSLLAFSSSNFILCLSSSSAFSLCFACCFITFSNNSLVNLSALSIFVIFFLFFLVVTEVLVWWSCQLVLHSCCCSVWGSCCHNSGGCAPAVAWCGSLAVCNSGGCATAVALYGVLSVTVGVMLLVGVVSGAILPGSCSTSCSSPSSPSTLLLNELLGTWLALSITYRGLVTALFLIMAWIAPNHKTSGTLTSSSLSTLAPLLRSLSTTSLYHFFNALPCP